MIVKCNKLLKSFSGHDSPILNNISLELKKGCFVSIMGRSGSGKTTLLRCICGLISIDGGDIEVAGKNVNNLSVKEQSIFRSQTIGIVFQDNNLINDFSVEDNILIPLYISKQKLDKNYYNRLLTLTELHEHKNKMPNQLSGGQKQKVAIVRAIITKPQIIFADEPTGSLDSKSEMQIMQLFKIINKEFGISIVQVTHSKECAKMSEQIIKINDGRVETV